MPKIFVTGQCIWLVKRIHLFTTGFRNLASLDIHLLLIQDPPTRIAVSSSSLKFIYFYSKLNLNIFFFIIIIKQNKVFRFKRLTKKRKLVVSKQNVFWFYMSSFFISLGTLWWIVNVRHYSWHLILGGSLRNILQSVFHLSIINSLFYFVFLAK